MRFAADTSVSVERSKGEIERILTRYGAEQFMSGWRDNEALIGFVIQRRAIRFMLPLPAKDSAEFLRTPGGRRTRSPADAERAWEQACRSRWRALALVIKAKLEAAETGISTIEDEFLAWTVLPGGDGRTVGEVVRPQIAASIESGDAARLQLGFA